MSLRRVYKPYGRAYQDSDGRTYPGVTSILNILSKPFLSPWQLSMMEGDIKQQLINSIDGECELNIKSIVEKSKKAADKYRDERAALGTRIHSAIEKRFNGEDLTELRKKDHKLSAIMFQIEKWITDNELDPILVEAYLVSKKYGYAGACDLVAKQNTEKFGPQVILVDYKSGKSVSEEQQWQLAAYAAAYFETYGICPDVSFLMHIDYDHQTISEEQHLHKSEVPEKFQEFLAIYGAFKAKWKKQLGAK